MDSKLIKLRQYTANLKVLYVEDDLYVSKTTTQLLKKFFKSVDIARDGEQGLDIYKKNDYDIIITDIRMPKLDGIEMSRSILEINENQNIIVTSAHNESNYLTELIELGIDKFISKPISTSSLVKAFSKVTKVIYLQKAEKKLQQELKEQVRDFEMIMNLNPNAIVIIENDKFIKGNLSFLSLIKLDTNDELSSIDDPLSKLLIQKENAAYAKTTKELLIELDNNEQPAIYLKVEEFEKRFFVSIINLSDSKQCLILSDVSEHERTVHLDVLTGLATKDFVIEKIEKLQENEIKFMVRTFSIANYDVIQRWLGPETSLRCEKRISNTIKDWLKNNSFKEKPIFGYFQNNRFVVLFHPNDISMIEKVLDLCDGLTVPSQERVLNKPEIGSIKISSSDIETEDNDINTIALKIEASYSY